MEGIKDEESRNFQSIEGSNNYSKQSEQ